MDVYKLLLQYKCKKTRKLASVERKIDTVLPLLRAMNFDHLEEMAYLRLLYAVEKLFSYTRKRLKKEPQSHWTRVVYYKAVAAKLGGHIPYTKFLDPAFESFRKFVEANALQHKLQTLKMRLEMDENGSPMILVHIDGGNSRMIAWDSLLRFPIAGGNYSYTYFGKEVFKTNSRFKLIDDYILTYKGITHYHPHENDALIAFDKKNPKEWGCDLRSSFILGIALYASSLPALNKMSYELSSNIFISQIGG